MQVASVAQGVEQVVNCLKGWWLSPLLLQSSFESILGQGTEPQIAPAGCATGVKLCVNEFLMGRSALCRVPLGISV